LKQATTWTDAELLHRDFDITGRPDGDPTLSRARPPEGATFRFLRCYDITPPRGTPTPKTLQPYVWCALCQEPTHWKGWEAELTNGPEPTRFLVGQQCARRNGGPAVKAAANQFDAQRARAEHLRTREAVLRIALQVRRALADWGASEGVAVVGEWRRALSSSAPGYYAELQQAAQLSPPMLVLEVEVRDHAAEEKQRRRRPSANIEPIYAVEYRAVAKVAGRALYAGSTPSVRIGRMQERLNAALAVLARATDGVKTQTIQQALSELRAVADGARELEQDFAQYGKGLENSAIDTVLDWFNKLPRRGGLDAKFHRKERELVVVTWERVKARAAIPDPVPIVRPVELTWLEEALAGRSRR
jgi:hypothetical protein